MVAARRNWIRRRSEPQRRRDRWGVIVIVIVVEWREHGGSVCRVGGETGEGDGAGRERDMEVHVWRELRVRGVVLCLSARIGG